MLVQGRGPLAAQPVPEAPGQPLLSLASSSDNGLSSTDKITSVLTPDFNMVFASLLEVGDVIKLYQDAVLYATSDTVAADDINDQIVRITFPPVTDGTYDWSITHVRGVSASVPSADETVTHDSTAPTISSVSPLDNAVDVALEANLTATFSEPIIFNSAVDIKLRRSSDDSIVQSFTEADIGAGISISGAVLTIDPEDALDVGVEHYVTIGATSLLDVAANFFAGIAAKTVWSFTATATDSQIAWKALATSTAGTASINYGTLKVGFAVATRVVAISLFYRGAVTANVVSVTVGGIAATQVPGAKTSNSGLDSFTDIWYVALPTGTTAEVVVVWSSGPSRSAVELHRILTSNPASADGERSSAGSSTSRSQAITVPVGGCALAFGTNSGSSNSTDVTFINATPDSSSLFVNLAGSSIGKTAIVNGTGSVTVTASIDGSQNIMALCLAAWSA